MMTTRFQQLFQKAHLAALLLGSAALAASGLADEPSRPHAIQSQRSTGALDRVEAVLEVGGDLKVADAAKKGKDTTTLKMSAVARLNYDEKLLASASDSDRPLRALRYYDKAEAVIKVGEDGVKPQLREERRLLAAEVRGPKVTLFSPRGPLTREELDLVDLLGNSVLLDRLLPDKPVSVNDSWKHPPELMAALCGLDEVHTTDVQSTLNEWTAQSAKISMAGHLEGKITGLSTKIELKARYRFDRKTGRIDWFALVLREDRSMGPIGPGLDVVAKLQMKISPLEKSDRLSAAVVKTLAAEPTTELEQLTYLSPGGDWELAHDRRWVIISEKRDAAVLRLVDRGDYLAQCSVSATLKDENKKITLSEFQEEIRQALGKNFQQFVRATESRNETDYRIYRVEVQGAVSEIPIDWIYYMVSNPQGRRVVLAFAIERSLVERFGQTDEAMIRTLRFVEPKLAAKPEK